MVLQPNIIVFANGINSASEMRQFCALDRCTSSHNPGEAHGIDKNHLWAFKLDEYIQCYRIHHPSGRNRKTEAKRARKHLLKLLCEAHQTGTER
jgi:hypothetical protein